LQEKYQYSQTWENGDIMMWDNMRTLHCAILDYGPDEHRHMERCQILSDKIRDTDFMAKAFDAARAAA
jgi:taurine dioxygenase